MFFFVIILFFSYDLCASRNQVSHALNLVRSVNAKNALKSQINFFINNKVVNPLDFAQVIAEKNIESETSKNVLTIDQELPVLQQSKFQFDKEILIDTNELDWQDVAKSEGGNCGYHALKNVLVLLKDKQLKENKISDNTLHDLLSSKIYQDYMSSWAVDIYKKRKSKNISWLDGQELENLIKKLKENKQIIVIEHRQGAGIFEYDPMVLQSVYDFVSLKNSVLGFIWNSGRQIGSSGGGSHWVGFVAVKNEKAIRIYEMNSASGIKPDLKVIQKLFASTSQEIQEKQDAQLSETMKYDIQNVKEMSLDKIFEICINRWNLYEKWPKEIQEDVAQLLEKHLKLAFEKESELLLLKKKFDLEKDLEFILKKLPTTQSRHPNIRQLAQNLIANK